MSTLICEIWLHNISTVSWKMINAFRLPSWFQLQRQCKDQSSGHYNESVLAPSPSLLFYQSHESKIKWTSLFESDTPHSSGWHSETWTIRYHAPMRRFILKERITQRLSCNGYGEASLLATVQ